MTRDRSRLCDRWPPERRAEGRADRRVATQHEVGDAPLEGSPLDQDMSAAGLATQADVGAEPVDEPLRSAARMAAPEANDIPQEQLEDGTVGHRRLRVSEARLAVAGHEVAAGGGRLDALTRRDRQGDARLGCADLGDDATDPRQ